MKLQKIVSEIIKKNLKEADSLDSMRAGIKAGSIVHKQGSSDAETYKIIENQFGNLDLNSIKKFMKEKNIPIKIRNNEVIFVCGWNDYLELRDELWQKLKIMKSQIIQIS